MAGQNATLFKGIPKKFSTQKQIHNTQYLVNIHHIGKEAYLREMIELANMNVMRK